MVRIDVNKHHKYLFHFLPISGADKDKKAVENRFRNIHARDKDDVHYNRILNFEQNLCHQIPSDATRSVLNLPYSITSITQRIIFQPHRALFKKIFGKSW